MNGEFVFDVHKHFIEHHMARIGMDPDPEQRYPDRITGTLVEPTLDQIRAVVIIKPVGYDNAGTFRRWVAVSPAHFDQMGVRPAGWQHFIMAVGLLPDGNPWWSSVYDERQLAEVRESAQHVSTGGHSGFYRFDPGLTAPARLSDWDKDMPTEPERPFLWEYKDLAGGFTTLDPAEFVEYIKAYATTETAPEDDDGETGRIDISRAGVRVTFG